jgi:hypothetical protein
MYQYIVMSFFIRVAYDNGSIVCMLLLWKMSGEHPCGVFAGTPRERCDVARAMRLREIEWRETR